MTVITPTTGRVVKRSLFWVVVALFVLVIVVVVVVASVARNSGEGIRLDSTNAAPTGGRAVAEVLIQQGVDVTSTTTLADTRAAITDPAGTTLFLYDDGFYLTPEQLKEAVGLADTVVIADPTFDELQAVAPALAQAGPASGTVDADCDLPAVRNAGSVVVDGSGYRVVDDGPGVTACLGSGDGAYSLIQLERDGTRLIVLGATEALTNARVLEQGNAAFALNLLGQNESLVWYIPSYADVPADQQQDLGSLTPPWVTPALALLLVAVVAGAFWRGRRFGPLVVENLPVTVRASETMLGRARLYERSSARLRALDALRIGSLQRLAGLCGLPRTASVDDIVASASVATGQQVVSIRRLLVDDVPASDADLVALSDQLLELERDVARAVRP